MGMVAPEQRIASAFFVLFGKYGDVSRYAQERGVCRQWVYREATSLRNALATAQQEIESLREQLRQALGQRTELEKRLLRNPGRPHKAMVYRTVGDHRRYLLKKSRVRCQASLAAASS